MRDNSKVGRNRGTTTRTAGTITINGTSWGNLDTGLDIALAATTADQIEVSMSSRWGSEAIYGLLDVSCVASGNYFGTAVDPSDNGGITAWQGPNSAVTLFGPPARRTLVVGDISGGIVTVRIRERTFTVGNKTIVATTSDSTSFFANNRGPHVEP